MRERFGYGLGTTIHVVSHFFSRCRLELALSSSSEGSLGSQFSDDSLSFWALDRPLILNDVARAVVLDGANVPISENLSYPVLSERMSAWTHPVFGKKCGLWTVTAQTERRPTPA